MEFVPRADEIMNPDWNIVAIYWTGSRIYTRTMFSQPKEHHKMLELWLDRPQHRRDDGWHPFIIGVFTGYLEAQWTREALTDGE